MDGPFLPPRRPAAASDALRSALAALQDALLPPRCAACLAPTHTCMPFCAVCQAAFLPAPAASPACFAYGGPLQAVLRQAKFSRDVVAAAALAALFAEVLVPPAALDAVTFVPAPWRRRLWRGFDLPALFARAVGRRQGLAVQDALVCMRHDAPLSHGADRATRARSVQGRFRVRGSVANQHVLLVDDVFTTGATLGCAQRTLEAAGAHVYVATLAAAL